jgi:hypothetical protein
MNADVNNAIQMTLLCSPLLLFDMFSISPCCKLTEQAYSNSCQRDEQRGRGLFGQVVRRLATTCDKLSSIMAYSFLKPLF